VGFLQLHHIAFSTHSFCDVVSVAVFLFFFSYCYYLWSGFVFLHPLFSPFLLQRYCWPLSALPFHSSDLFHLSFKCVCLWALLPGR
jgi:hypothetical protein